MHQLWSILALWHIFRTDISSKQFFLSVLLITKVTVLVDDVPLTFSMIYMFIAYTDVSRLIGYFLSSVLTLEISLPRSVFDNLHWMILIHFSLNNIFWVKRVKHLVALYFLRITFETCIKLSSTFLKSDHVLKNQSSFLGSNKSV